VRQHEAGHLGLALAQLASRAWKNGTVKAHSITSRMTNAGPRRVPLTGQVDRFTSRC
jgi:hypothetical protein